MKQLSEDACWDLLDSRPGWAALTTIDSDGLPHTVAIGYFRLEKVLYCGVRAGTHKCRNLQANPAVALMVESGKAGEKLRGVMLQGHGRVIEDHDELLALKRRLAEQRNEPAPTEVKPGIAYLEIQPQRIRSWTS